MNVSQQIRRAARIELSRRSFWHFCKVIAPDFYQDNRKYLFDFCMLLQKLYEGTLLKPDGTSYKKLMVNMPPQHGKTRTLVNFSAWIFGKKISEKIITASYNDTTASDFSRYTRDTIAEIKNSPEQIVYSDIFPLTKIKRGNAGHERWALDGQHFSYIGAGVGGSITSKGGTVLEVDDPIKGAEEALNENHLEKCWLWYTSTFLSRTSAKGGEPIEIMNMTRWSNRDLCGRILAGKGAIDWYIYKLEVYDSKTDTMLCEEIFGKKRYLDQMDAMEPGIFYANYHQQPIDSKGVLFPAKELNYFQPSEVMTEAFESSLAYCDIADEGNDYMAAPIGRTIGPKVYITDFVFSKDNADVTMELMSGAIKQHGVKYCRVESNAMGAMYGRGLRKLVPECMVLMVNSTTNKHTRIIMEAGFIMRYFHFIAPELQSDQYKRAMQQLCAYLKESKNQQKDDAPDAMSGLSLFVRSMLKQYY